MLNFTVLNGSYMTVIILSESMCFQSNLTQNGVNVPCDLRLHSCVSKPCCLQSIFLLICYFTIFSSAPGPTQTEPRSCAPQVSVCPAACTCNNNNVIDCRRKSLTEIPANLPEGIVEMYGFHSLKSFLSSMCVKIFQCDQYLPLILSVQ